MDDLEKAANSQKVMLFLPHLDEDSLSSCNNKVQKRVLTVHTNKSEKPQKKLFIFLLWKFSQIT